MIASPNCCVFTTKYTRSLFTGNVNVAVLNLNVGRTVWGKHAFVFEGCSVVIFYTSVKVTFLKVLDQKSDFEIPCSVAKLKEGKFLRWLIQFCRQPDHQFSFT